jgi:hypothetical protein
MTTREFCSKDTEVPVSILLIEALGRRLPVAAELKIA